MTDNPQSTSPGPTLSTDGTLVQRMGIELLETGPERTSARMPVAGNTQPYGLLHGGASAVLAETVGSVAAALHAGPGRIANVISEPVPLGGGRRRKQGGAARPGLHRTSTGQGQGLMAGVVGNLNL